MFQDKFGLKLENGVPTDDTFQRIFAVIKPDQLEKCFRNWVKSAFKTEKHEIISLDGKTICGSRDDNYSFIHVVSAWANKTGIVLGQMRVDEKSNEITAVPQLLDLIEAENCVFTSDAMSCQKKTVEKIISKHCDYVICLKGNQETLHEDVKLYFETALSQPQLYDVMKSQTKTEKGHGRIETRQYFLSTEISNFISAKSWKGIAAIGMVRSKRIVNGEESTENRYFITAIPHNYCRTDAQSDFLSDYIKILQAYWCMSRNFCVI